jgi:hypothetical protein
LGVVYVNWFFVKIVTPIALFNLKAFIAALCTLDAPLPPEVQRRVNAVAESGDYGKLDAIARESPQLQTSYQSARKVLRRLAKERNKSSDFMPAGDPEPLNSETENLARDIADLNDMPQLLEAIEAELDESPTANNPDSEETPSSPSLAQTILSSDNSFAIARQWFPYRGLG